MDKIKPTLLLKYDRKIIIPFLLLTAIILPYRLINIQKPLTSITNFRQAQTATIALNFYKNGINLLQTELDIFGKGKERYLTLEFPFYEASVSFLYRLFFVSDMWGRLVSVIAGIIGGWFLYLIVLTITNNRYLSVFSAFFFFIAPLNMYHQRDFLIEPIVIATLLAGFYFSIKFLHPRGVYPAAPGMTLGSSGVILYFILAIIFLSLGFIQKGMYGPFWLLPLACFFKKKKFKIISFPTLMLFTIPLFILFLWQNHVNFINSQNGHSYFTTTDLGHLVWNFGALEDRFSPSLWEFRAKNILNGILLKPGLILLLFGLAASWKKKKLSFFYWWLLAEVIYFLLLFRIQSHNYYQMVMIPVIAVFEAYGLLWIKRILQKRVGMLTAGLFIAISCSFLLARAWVSSQWDVPDVKWYQRLMQVKSVVPENSWGIFVNPGNDWNSVYTYYPRLQFKAVEASKVSETEVRDWKKEGYAYLILHEYDQYPPLEFLSKYTEVLSLEDFKVFIL